MSQVKIDPEATPILNLFSQGTIIENHMLYTSTVIQTIQMQVNNIITAKNQQILQLQKMITDIKNKDSKPEKK